MKILKPKATTELALATDNIQVRQAVAITNTKYQKISECNMKVY
jgi:hypothetical protein